MWLCVYVCIFECKYTYTQLITFKSQLQSFESRFADFVRYFKTCLTIALNSLLDFTTFHRAEKDDQNKHNYKYII